MTVENTALFGRIYGSLMAGAVGDAMGFPAEGHHYETIRRKWGRVDRLITRADGETMTPKVETPVYTDDSVMRHMVCEVLIESEGRPTAYDVARVWKRHITDLTDWRWWNNSRIVGAKLQWGWPGADPRQLGQDSIPCNDAAMIIAPVGLVNVGNAELAAYQALEMSGVWQKGYSRDCGAAMAAAHAEAVSPGATIDSVVAAAMAWSTDLATYLERTLKLAEACKGDCEAFTSRYYAECVPGPLEEYWMGIGWKDKPDEPWSFNADPLEVCSLGVAFFYLTQADTREAIITGASFGRDCDTISGIAGSLSAAINGIESVPKDWAKELMGYCPEPDIKGLAEKLTAIAIKRKTQQH